MFHVELRRFPHVARAFNLSREELEERIVKPWLGGAIVEFDDRQWEPARTRLAIYEGPQLRPEEMGMGRGWAGVTRAGTDVTDRILQEARGSISDFKQALLARGRLTLAEVVALAGQGHPGVKVSDRLALAEQAVWELLHQGRLTLVGPAGAVEREQWGPVLLRWQSWTDGSTAIAPLRDDLGD
jgi:hypothetical protein